MPLPPEVAKTIQGIDKKIKALEDVKRSLLETFGEPVPTNTQPISNGNKGVTPVHRVESPQVTLPSQGPATLSSSERLIMFLRANGPATRKEIIERSGVPDGSISYLLKNGKFRQREDE